MGNSAIGTPATFLENGFYNPRIFRIAAYYHKDETKIIKQYQKKLTAEWQKFKYDMFSWTKTYQKISSPMPKERRNNQQIRKNENIRKITAMEWSLELLVIMQHEHGHYCEELLQFAQIVLSAPITNAFLECGVNAIKRLKTRLQNCLK